jgi:hypothetical protein
MWTSSNLPLTAVALAHGELFLWDIAGRTLAVSHGFGKRRDDLDLERRSCTMARIKAGTDVIPRLSFKGVFIAGVGY